MVRQIDTVAAAVNTTLGFENGEIPTEVIERSILRAQAAARIIYKNPELGTEEVHTSDVVSHEFARILGSESVYVLVKQDIGAPVVENGVLIRHSTPIWARSRSTQNGDYFMQYVTDTTEMGGVMGILEGDDPEGPTIAIFGDLDALKNGHHCGHNAHLGGLIADAALLREYKNQGGYIPANKIVFIARVNEEGLNPNKQFSDAQEMINAGALDIIGTTPDVVLSAHVLPSAPLGEVVLDRGSTTHSAGFFSIKLEQGENANIPAEVLMARIICRISDEWKSETVEKSVTRVIGLGDHSLSTMVRVSDSGDSSEKRDTSSLKSQKQIILPVMPGQDKQIAALWNDLAEWQQEWAVQTGVSYRYMVSGNKLILEMNAPGGHIAESGPNIEYLMARIITHFDESGILWQKDGANRNVDLSGTIRLKAKKWREKGKSISQVINAIAKEEAENAGYRQESRAAVVVPPVVNSPWLRETADKLIYFTQLSHFLRNGHRRMLAGYAEPLAFWQNLFNAETLLLWVGIGDKNEIEANQLPVLGKMQLHNENMIVPSEAVPYLGILGMLALKAAADWKQR